MSIRHGLLCGKRFRGYQKQCRFYIDLFQYLCNMRTVDIATEEHLEVTLTVRLEGLTYHYGT